MKKRTIASIAALMLASSMMAVSVSAEEADADAPEVITETECKAATVYNIDTSTPTGKLMLTMIAAISEFERANLLERQREGIAIAKKNGVYKGRAKTVNDNFGELYGRYLNRQMNKSELAKALGVSRPTLNRMISEYN